MRGPRGGSPFDEAATWANGFGDDQRGDRRHFGADRSTARIEGREPFARELPALRRYENKAISTFPSNAGEQRKVSVRLGYDDFEAFRRDYVDAREVIHAVYERRIGNP